MTFAYAMQLAGMGLLGFGVVCAIVAVIAYVVSADEIPDNVRYPVLLFIVFILLSVMIYLMGNN